MHCEEVLAERIAREAGTPAFVYSAAVIRDRYRKLDAALAGVPHRIHYSLKANSNRGILTLLRELGSGVDVVSGGELFRALHAGFGAQDIIFGGVGKTAKELSEALQAGIKMINVESEAELLLLDRIAGEQGVQAPVGLRINPEVAVATRHEYIATGAKGHKFGIPYEEAAAVIATAVSLRHVAVVGLDMHVGSQLQSFEPYRHGIERLASLASQARALGAPLKYVDIGGGLPVAYGDGDADPDLEAWQRVVIPAVREIGAELLVEPGRFFAAASGVLLARVLYRKKSGGKDYVICDAGMTELLRPSHYDAYHFIETAGDRAGRARVDVVGPVCESGDFLALDREMEDAQPGDLLVIHTAGAYGYVMSSTYNSRARAAEVMVDGHRFAVVTAREHYEDLVRLEHEDPDWRDA